MENFRRTKIYKVCGYIGIFCLLSIFIPLIFLIFNGQGFTFIFAIGMLLGITMWYPISIIILIIAFFITKDKTINSKYNPLADIGNCINLIISITGVIVFLNL